MFYKRLLRLLRLCFYLASLLLTAQNAIQVKALGVEDGLNFRHVNTIAQDERGFMWFGTRQGITRYDGKLYKVFNSSRNNPNRIPYDYIMKFAYQGSTHTLWYIANHKLFALDLNTESLKPLDGMPKAVDGEVLDIALDHNQNLWIVNDHPKPDRTKTQHLLKYDGQNFQVIKYLERKSAGLTSLSITQNNEICWTTVNHGLMVFNQLGEVLNQRIIDTYDYYGHTIHYAGSFFDSGNRHYYFSESKGGVDVLQDLEFKQRLVRNNSIIHFAVEDQSKGIWFTGKKKLFYSKADGEVIDYTTQIEQSLKSFNITCAFVDQSNLLWIGTDNGILKVKSQPKSFEKILHFKDQDWGLSFRSIFSLSNGDIIAMCETESELYRLNTDESIRPAPVALKNTHIFLKDARYFAVEPTADIAYTVTNDLIEIDFNSNQIKLYSEFSPYLNETKPNPIIRLKDGSLVAGYTLSKLIHIDAKTKAFRPVFQNKPKDDFILKTLIQSDYDNNVLWIGTESKGLFKINLDGDILEHYDIDSAPALSNNSILSLFETTGELLIGTFGGGVNRLNTEENKIQVIDKQIGLCDNNVVSILPVNDKIVMAATYNGLSKINLEKLDIQNYFEKDGISDNEFNYTSAYKSEEGAFYFGGLNGITRLSFEKLPKKNKLPPLNFTRLEYYNQTKDTTVQFNRLNEMPIILSPYDINLKVAWSMPEYFDFKDYTYYTKLEGFDDNWLYQDNNNSITYNKLPAGDYNLKVKATDKNGNLSQSMLEVPITINQIFYKSWWFIVLTILAVSAIVYSFFQYRLQQALAIERLRTKISSELHDDVGSMLTGLAMQTEMLEMQAKSKSDKKELKRLTQLSRNTIAHMRDFVWSLDSRKDSLEDLIERMQEYAEEYLLPAGIQYKMVVEGIQRTKKLNLNCRKNLFLIFKEAIANILKHSNAKNVQVHIVNRKSECRFMIKDDGKINGIKKSTGQGLANMKMRSEHMNASLKFDTVDGFCIELSLPQNF